MRLQERFLGKLIGEKSKNSIWVLINSVYNPLLCMHLRSTFDETEFHWLDLRASVFVTKCMGNDENLPF